MVKRRFDVNHVEERVWARCDDSDATFLMRFYVVGFDDAPLGVRSEVIMKKSLGCAALAEVIRAKIRRDQPNARGQTPVC